MSAWGWLGFTAVLLLLLLVALFIVTAIVAAVRDSSGKHRRALAQAWAQGYKAGAQGAVGPNPYDPAP